MIISISDAPSDFNAVHTVSVFIEGKHRGDVIRVDLYADDVFIGSVTETPYNFFWDTTLFADGEHILQADAIWRMPNSHPEQIEQQRSVVIIGDPQPVEQPAPQVPNLPVNYDFRDQDIVISHGDGIAALSVNSDVSGVDYGALQLASTGREAGVRTYGDASDGVFYANKMQDDLPKFFDLCIDGFPSVTLDAASPTLAVDIANALIDLGLAVAP